ncbi:MAG: carbohydrate kinase family protein [Patescibacteria group bacterium]|nr:carbohydrate kinase family protein [Patescibacteria group bacterium]
MFNLISIGDAVIDTFIPLKEALVHSWDDGPKLCLNYGDKIPTGSPVSLVAGNASNAVIAASHLGLKTAAYINVGNDSDGEDIKNKLKEEKVDIRYVRSSSEYPTNRHVVLDFKGERTILIYHQPWKYELPDLDKSRWIYFTSLSPTFAQSNLVEQLVGYLERNGVRLLYNPGTFQISAGVKKNPRLLSLTEVFIVNLEEAKLILGFKENEDVSVKKLLKSLLDLGPKMAVVTDGKNGSYGSDGESFYHLGVLPAKVVEMTGAGDAYASGLLAGLFYGKNLAEAMRWGAANSASVIEQVGPIKGLLSYDKIQERLKENTRVSIKKL